MPRFPRLLLVALALRSLHLLHPHTFFQPDEFYQALEPAHRLVFGTGHLTWEWRDLPAPPGADPVGAWLARALPALPALPAAGAAWERAVVCGRMRGWIWPAVFAGVYELLRRAGLDGTAALATAPRVVGVLVAALTDYCTALFAAKVLGRGAAATALFLSLTSLFNAHALPRALATSPETLLTVAALVFFPLPRTAGGRGAAAARGGQAADGEKAADGGQAARERADGARRVPPDLSCVAIERAERAGEDAGVAVSTALAATALCVRPTMAAFWVALHAERTIALARRSPAAAALYNARVLSYGMAVVAASTALDYAITGRLAVPFLTFLHRNLVLNLSSYYGRTTALYHLTQSLPILVFPLHLAFLAGALASLLPRALLPPSLARLDAPPALRQLARAAAAALLALSLSPHSEWRFLHPLLPVFLVVTLPALFAAYRPRYPTLGGISHTARQYLRLSPRAFYGLLLAPLVPFVYLNTWHGAAQVEVANALRRGALGDVGRVVVLAPCHSTPWASHLHAAAGAGWFLTCEPPLGAAAGAAADEHWTREALFYAAPVSYLATVFPYPPMRLRETATSTADGADADDSWPSHVVLFGAALALAEDVGVDSAAWAMGEGGGGSGREGEGVGEGEHEHEDEGGHARTAQTRRVTVADVLRARGYAERWRRWNGFDALQDEPARRGGVRVWARDGGGRAGVGW